MASSSAIGWGTVTRIIVDAVEASHVLKIHVYSRTKGLRNGEYIKSDTFNVGGHGWNISYYPDGNGSNDAGWISFFLYLKSSSASEVEAKFKFSLLDEMGEPVPSYCMGDSTIHTFKTIDSGWGYKRFIERKALEESTYLMDDCFRVRCDIIISKPFRTEDTKKFVTVPPPDMHQHIGRLLSSQEEADVTFQVGTETITAHRLVLAARSPVFMAELFGPMKENHTQHIQIDDMEAKVFKTMLHFVYTDSFPDMEKDEALAMAQHLLVAADRYDLARLKLMCEDKLCNCISSSTVMTNLALADQHSCHGLQEACFEFLKSHSNLKAAMASDGFDNLMTTCPSVIKELLLLNVPASPWMSST